MSELENRLLRCFVSVFPGLTQEEIRSANTQSKGVWDSLSSVTLAAVVQEEFNLEIDPETLPQLDSYEAFRSYLSRTNPVTE
ncbi:MAG TPA: acyl carrier protein [Candidatus Dormibacteraeota bacterium]|jgi:acyl carrier protein|nr:acyl carrier protein [Candidatus Dormibacteraeota bacterium]